MKTKIFKFIILIGVIVGLFWFNTPEYKNSNHLLNIILIVVLALILRSFTHKEEIFDDDYEHTVEKQKNYLIFIVSVIILIITIVNPYSWINSIMPINWISSIVKISICIFGFIGMLWSGLNIALLSEEDYE